MTLGASKLGGNHSDVKAAVGIVRMGIYSLDIVWIIKEALDMTMKSEINTKEVPEEKGDEIKPGKLFKSLAWSVRRVEFSLER